MQLKITEKKEQPILSRTSVKAHIIFDKSTPSADEVKKALASELKADEALVVVNEIYTEFGKPEADVNAYVYASKEEMQKIEPKPKEKEGKPGEKKEEKPAEAKKEEKPAEKKEEAPKEAPAEEKKEEAPAEKPAEEKKE